MGLRCYAWAAAMVIASVVAWASTEPAPPQHQLKSYPLPNSPNSADISPDEQLVATECTIQEDVPGPEIRKSVEIVQLWNFEQGKLVGQVRLKQTELNASTKGPRFVRFSGDSTLIVAYVDHMLHILRTSDLAEIRAVELAGPSSTSHTHTHKGTAHTFVTYPVVRAFEVSPRADVAAILWVRGISYGRVELRGLASGELVGAWDTPTGWFFDGGMVWHPNGELLLLAVPNSIPCLSPTNSADIFAFKVPSGAIEAELKTGLLVSGIAVTPDDRVLAVDGDCMTVFKDHNPKLRVFNLKTGEHLHDLGGRGTGVRYTVSAARSGGRVLAYTGKLKIKFDWGDFVADDVRVDATFSVWNLKDYSGVVTSPDLKGISPVGLRISPGGRYVVSCGKASSVYELP